MRCFAPIAFLAAITIGAPALAAACPGNREALGTSRVLSVSPREYSRIGGMQYSQFPQLPLNDHEVVLTFDDGPLPPYTDSVLKTLAADCVKATFFIIGRQANQFPDMVRRIYNEGHVVGTHSQNHPLTFDQMSLVRAKSEIDAGIASVSAALGEPRAVAPFFRIPGLLRVAEVDNYLGSKSIAVWSADFDADDWYRIASPEGVVQKAMARLKQKGRGVLLLHDVQPVTAMALPMLLKELKAGSYRIVQVVPEGKRAVLHSPNVAPANPGVQSWPRTVRQAAPPGVHRKKANLPPPRSAATWRDAGRYQVRKGLDGWLYVAQ
jgi:peptidoglycan/xylan/chitin deacetylase (PgdA/CDA1 family)